MKKFFAFFFAALMVGIITTSSGFSQRYGQTFTASGQISKSTGGSDWSKAVNRTVTAGSPVQFANFSATGYYSGLKGRMRMYRGRARTVFIAMAKEPMPIRKSWFGRKMVYSNATTLTVNMVIKTFYLP